MSQKEKEPGKDSVRPPLETLWQLAGNYSRRHEEIDDLVQDLLLETVRTGRDMASEHFMAWAHGYLRNRAAFIARKEGRRRKREKKACYQHEDTDDHNRPQFPIAFIEQLSPALRKTARLINCGLNKKEIIYLLDVTDMALRQRFMVLRREWQAHLEAGGAGAEIRDESHSPFNNGLLRQSLRNSFHGNPDKVIGSFDPDGHLLVFRSKSAHKKESGGNNRVEEDT